MEVRTVCHFLPQRACRVWPLVWLFSAAAATVAQQTSNSVLVTVNGDAVTTADLELACLARGLAGEVSAGVRQQVLEQLVDERLLKAFLAQRRAEPNPVALDAQIERIHGLIRKQGSEPAEVLGRLGFTDDSLRERLALPLAWETHVGRIITETRLQSFFDEHRREFDGTQVSARHILFMLPPDADRSTVDEASRRLVSLREQINRQEISFVEAARQHSQAPSSRSGGDVGSFPFRGVMPVPFATAAFAAPVGELLGPVRTPAGLHLILVTAETPGQLSLEDVRGELQTHLSQELWEAQVASERASATIIRAADPLP